MGSRVVGFRVPEDLAEELEKVSNERGQSTAEFLRKLVDDALYPSKDREDDDALSASEVVGNLVDDIKSHDEAIHDFQEVLKTQSERLDKLVCQQNADTQAITQLGEKHENLWGIMHHMTEMNDEHKKVCDRDQGKLHKMIEDLGEGLNSVITNLATHGHDNLKPIPELIGKMGKLEQALEKMQSQIEYLANVARRQPTGDVVELTLNDNTKHYYRKYKSNLGLTNSHHVVPSFGDPYWVDLSEPDK